MKVFIQLCDEGRRFHLTYEGGARYGTFELVVKQRIAHVVPNDARVADWMKTSKFNEALVSAYENYLAKQVVGVEDDSCHAVTTFESSHDHILDALRYLTQQVAK